MPLRPRRAFATITVITLAAVAALSATRAPAIESAPSSVPAWSLRYAALTKPSDQQRAHAAHPDFRITLPQAKAAGAHRTITINDQPDGPAAGSVFIARPITQCDPTWASVRIALSYRKGSDHPHGRADLSLWLFTAKAWAKLAADPADAKALPDLKRTQAVRLDTIRPNSKTWQTWQSRNVTLPWHIYHNQHPLLVIQFTGHDAGRREWAQIKNIHLKTVNFSAEIASRTPQYPLKTARTLHTDAQIAQALDNIKHSKRARSIYNNIIKNAQPWLKRSDERIREMIPPPSVPRAFNVGTLGCPIHGKAIYKHGTYPWIIHADKPYEIECPIGHEVYGKGFFQYVQSGFKDRAALQGKYPDDGWGWLSPKGDRYWLVGYACHWYWDHVIFPGVLDLSRAYILTGDRRYAHKAALMLAIIAREYPAFDLAKQSRYSWLTHGQYQGKIVNRIWATGVLRKFAEAYDNIWNSIDADKKLQREMTKIKALGPAAILDGNAQSGTHLAQPLTGRDIRAMIEANLLEEGIASIYDDKILGNFGSHQAAQATTAIVRQHGPKRWITDLFTMVDKNMSFGNVPMHEGLNYAFYNLIYRDGYPFETSPGYNGGWVNHLTQLAAALKPGGTNLFAWPKMHDLALTTERIRVCGFIPSEGDAGGVFSNGDHPDAIVYQTIYRQYHNPYIGQWLKKHHKTGENSFATFASLFHPPITVTGPAPKPMPSRLLDGYGMAILHNQDDTLGISLYYGRRGGHGHRDALNFALFALGHKMMPDLGYPDAMNGFVPGIFSWTKNTISHNTVMIDRHQQNGNAHGSVRHFLNTPTVQAVEVSDPKAYSQASIYRRCLVLIETAKDRGYLVDIFHVRGGKEQRYSLHGPPGKVTLASGQWSKPAKGTLAGPGVKVGELYDAPKMDQPDYDGTYSKYYGSGFSHFTDVQRLESGRPRVVYQHLKDADACLQIILLLAKDQHALVAEAYVRPVRRRYKVKYLLVHHAGDKDLDSVFAAVCEPYDKNTGPTVKNATRTAIDYGVAITVDRGYERDVILYRTGKPGVMQFDGVRTTADIAVLTFTQDGALKRAVFDHGTLDQGSHHFTRRTLTATVIRLDPAKRQAVVRFDQPVSPSSLLGQYAAFTRGGRIVRHPVIAAQPVTDGLRLTFGDALRIGRGQVANVTGDQVQSDTRFTFAKMYAGCVLTNEAQSAYLPVKSIKSGHAVTLTNPPPQGFFTDANHDGVKDFWLIDFGPGAKLHFTPATP